MLWKKSGDAFFVPNRHNLDMLGDILQGFFFIFDLQMDSRLSTISYLKSSYNIPTEIP